MTIDITQIIVALIGVVLSVATALITKVVVPWIKARTSETTQSIIEAAATAAVYAAQQLYASGTGEDKKSYAVTYMTDLLGECGLTVNADTVSSAIESALKAVKVSAGDTWNT